MSDKGTMRVWAAVAALAAATAGTAVAPGASAQPTAQAASLTSAATHSPAVHPTTRSCAQPSHPGLASCTAIVRTDVPGHKGLFTAAATPSGYGPADLQAAYALPSASAGSGDTVAIVDAFDDPNAEADLAVYRAQYGLPPCTTANGCFAKVAQDGSTNYPPPDAGWSEEISLDVDMVSAVCPACHILLVEATDNTIQNLGTAVNEAVALGAVAVSNSYIGAEDPAETGWDTAYYDHPGVAVTAASGDGGYGVGYPATSPYVTAVGGTTLTHAPGTARGWTETAWGSASGGLGAGSGCSAFEPKPAWQVDTGCANRTVADTAAVADPNTGVAVYDTYQVSGWNVFGGTSVATPITASVYALAGAAQPGSNPAQYPYDALLAGAGGINDVTSGADGTCTPAYLCTAGPGYDGPTGLGTPDGTTAFTFRAHGTVSGTVTDAATGQPVAGAHVQAAPYPPATAVTGGDGGYSLTLPAGSYQVTASDYGYDTQTTGVTVTANATTRQDFALTGTPHETVSGTVTAGTGTPWPLYAQVTWSDGAGHGGTTFTTPANGNYSLSLLAGASYTLQVTPRYPGYQPATAQITVAASAVTQNIALPVDLLACTAIGYHAVDTGATQAFSAASTPAGWAVTNTNLHYPGYSDRPGWVFTNPGARANTTGGTGNFAIVDSDHYGQFHYQDTELISPAVSFADFTIPVLQFATDLQPAVNSTATADISTDGGKTWANVWRNAAFPGDPGPATVVIPLPQAAGAGHVRVRFGYTGQWSQWWEIDNVFLGNRACTQQTGGLLTGRVSDSGGTAVNGATVASVTNPGQTALTAATPGDDTIGGGFYALFTTATGTQQFTASMTGYTTATQTTTITPGQVTTLDFTLTAVGASSAATRSARPRRGG